MTEEKKLFFSILLPTWNRPDLLRETIKSVLKQTYKNFEVIIVDDGDKKRANKVVSEFNDQRITYIQHDKNYGSPVAKNTALKVAKGEWVAFLDDDDEWFSEYLEKKKEIIDKYGDKISYVFCGVEFYNTKTKEIYQRKAKLFGLANYYEHIITFQIKPITSTLMVKKDVLDRVGGFDNNTPANQEMDLLYRMGGKEWGYSMEDILVRMKGAHGERMGTDMDRRIRGKMYFINKHKKILEKRPRALAEQYYALAECYRFKEDYKNSRRYYFKTFKNCKITGKKARNSFLKFLFLFFPKLFTKVIKTKKPE
ncbi:glycosyltransferase family 2 protein [Candidatus Parcubacteria bacterium]|nr:glycosyltransferase family 2 protein [Candidatus Parcubacteria bacterium]